MTELARTTDAVGQGRVDVVGGPEDPQLELARTLHKILGEAFEGIDVAFNRHLRGAAPIGEIEHLWANYFERVNTSMLPHMTAAQNESGRIGGLTIADPKRMKGSLFAPTNFGLSLYVQPYAFEAESCPKGHAGFHDGDATITSRKSVEIGDGKSEIETFIFGMDGASLIFMEKKTGIYGERGRYGVYQENTITRAIR